MELARDKSDFSSNMLNFYMGRAVTKALIGGGGGGYSYIRVLPDELLLKSVIITVNFKRNSSG